jgi:hypothetical protein
MLGFKPFKTEQCPLIDIELMHMFKQRPMVIEGRGNKRHSSRTILQLGCLITQK